LSWTSKVRFHGQACKASAESWNTTDRMSRGVYMSAVSHTTFRARLKPEMRWLEQLLLVASRAFTPSADRHLTDPALKGAIYRHA
jgi:hypothetical protein